MITNRQKKHKGVTVRTIVGSILVISMLTVSVLTALSGNSPAVAKIKIQPPEKHLSAYIKGYLRGCNDGPEQENFVATSPHSKALIKGYNYAFSHGC
jgi:hypothetical protein